MTKQGNQSINTNGSRCNQAFQTMCKSNYNCVEPNYISWDPMMQDTPLQARSTWQHTLVTIKVGVFYSAIASTSMCRSKVLVKKCSLINLSKIWGMCCHLLRLGHPWTLLLSFWKKKTSALFGIQLYIITFCSLWNFFSYKNFGIFAACTKRYKIVTICSYFTKVSVAARKFKCLISASFPH